MSDLPVPDRLGSIWNNLSEDAQKPLDIIYLALLGFLIGLASGLIISVFRISADFAFSFALHWNAAHGNGLARALLWLAAAIAAALIVGRLVLNQAIRFGGYSWILQALADGQKRPWLKILLPKFVGSWLVMACGISVGREGPCIEMGAATALGIKNLDAKNAYERRYFILCGCAAGLAAAFSAPFAGICYVFEIMREKFSKTLLMFMLAGSFGVYVANTEIFGLDLMMPITQAPMPKLGDLWLLAPLGFFAALVGIAYNYLLRASKAAYGSQKLVPTHLQPLFAFVGAAIMLQIYPDAAGEGLRFLHSQDMRAGLVGALALFLFIKLLFTAFCYGSAIPAGLMVPVLCLGGVCGGIFGDISLALGLMGTELSQSCMVIGMAASFAAAERAPLTAIVLVGGMTGAWQLAAGMLLAGAIGALCARIARVEAV